MPGCGATSFLRRSAADSGVSVPIRAWLRRRLVLRRWLRLQHFLQHCPLPVLHRTVSVAMAGVLRPSWASTATRFM